MKYVTAPAVLERAQRCERLRAGAAAGREQRGRNDCVEALEGSHGIHDASRREAEKMVGAIGFEPTTPTMSRWCSTTELRA